MTRSAEAERSWPLVAFLALAFYAFDQLTKWLVIRAIEFETGRTIIDGFFTLVHVGNTGAAFSMFQDGNKFFVGLSIVTLIVLAVLFARDAFRGRWMETGLGLLVAGILGNLTDRMVHGHVIDFLSFDLHLPFASPWPAFNVADSCICVATVMFVIHSLREQPPAAAAAK